jgi:neutral ceramidase
LWQGTSRTWKEYAECGSIHHRYFEKSKEFITLKRSKGVHAMRSFQQKSIFLVFAVCACLALAAPRNWGAEPHNLQAGAAKVDITPKDITGLISVGNRPFQGVHDAIFARALVLDNGVTSSAIVEADLVEMGDTTSLRERIAKELSIPADHIMIAATHDHSAPRSGPITAGTSSVEGRPYATPAYTKQVDESILEALRQAKASLQPARVGFGTGQVDVNVQRMAYTARGWQSSTDVDGFADKTVWVLKFDTPAGVPIAILMNYAVHSVVGGGDGKISGDLGGMAERYVERQFPDKFVAVFSMGAAADEFPKFTSRQGDKTDSYEASEVQGNMLGGEVVAVANRITHMSPVATIEASQRGFPCDMFVPPPPTPRTNAGGGPGGQAGGGPGQPGGGQQQAQQPRPADLPPQIPVKPGDKLNIQMSLIRINEVAITSVSGEVGSDIFLHLKKESPLANMLMITLANDRVGYIPSEAEWDRFTPAYVRGCAEKVIVDNLVEMMNASVQN